MLGTDNRVWLIDFGVSGFYPVPFEHVAMMYSWTFFLRNYSTITLKLLVGVATGFYHRYYSQMYVAIAYFLWDAYLVE